MCSICCSAVCSSPWWDAAITAHFLLLFIIPNNNIPLSVWTDIHTNHYMGTIMFHLKDALYTLLLCHRKLHTKYLYLRIVTKAPYINMICWYKFHFVSLLFFERVHCCVGVVDSEKREEQLQQVENPMRPRTFFGKNKNPTRDQIVYILFPTVLFVCKYLQVV